MSIPNGRIDLRTDDVLISADPDLSPAKWGDWPLEADAIRDAAVRVLEQGESVASIARDWTARGIKPVAAKQWWPTSIVGTLTSARLVGLRERQGQEVPDHAVAGDHRHRHP